MKRIIFFVGLSLISFIFLCEEYKLYLKDGKVIVTDTKPQIVGDRVYFERFGMLLYIPVNLVDLERSERVKSVTKEEIKEVKKKKVRRVSDEELEDIRKRVRLANEEELAQGELTSTSEHKEGQGQGEEGTKDLQSKLNSLIQERTNLQSNVMSLMTQLDSLRDQYGFATMAADKERLQSEISDVERRLSEARSRLASVENQILATQQEIASKPIVVEAPSAKTPPPAQPQPQQQTPPPSTESGE